MLSHFITDEQGSALVALMTADDVKKTIFLKANKAQGPDGFTSEFFQSSWSIVGKIVTKDQKAYAPWVYDDMSSLRTLPSFQERSDAAIERYKLASPEWRERVAPCQQLKILQWFSLIRSSGRKEGYEDFHKSAS
ncbi:hypothetical protein KIW84_072140 [Lathyrus oleraceus]|uniref:Uncharacterized protein n=1 Tax=Pisum sativum TaxID=3888 RepID=A0A9D4VKH0_PEA|nr:hypothetical protein KIW84_072140 [Pisum sativum]